MHWYFIALKKFGKFSGRAARREYWLFSLVNILTYLLFAGVDCIFGIFDSDDMLGVVSSIYLLAVLLPTLAVSVRRLHDIDRNGWWFLITLLPLVGGATFLMMMIMEGTVGPNRYGPDPGFS